MIKHLLGEMDEADWLLLGLSVGLGFLWSCASVFLIVGDSWIASPSSGWEWVLQTVLLWPVVAAFVTSRTLLDPGAATALTVGYGLGAGVVGGVLLVRYLRHLA